MSGNDPLGPDDFNFQEIFQQLGQLFGSLGGGGISQPSDPWGQARQIAVSIASEGGAERNVEPAERMAIEDLARVADLHARQRPGVHLAEDVRVAPVSRSTWTADAVTAYRPFFERFTEAISQEASTELPISGDLPPEEAAMIEPMAKMMGQLMSQFVPMMVVNSAGAMIGHVGQRIVGTYDLPIPRQGQVVQVIPAGMREIADATGAPLPEVQMYLLIHELLAHATLTVPHVAARLESLYLDFASAFRPNPTAIMEQMGDITDLAQLIELQSTLNDPEAVLGMMRTRAHDLLMPQLDALVAAVLGFVENATMAACAKLMKGHPAIRDAIRSRRVDRTDAENFMEKLLGLNIDNHTLDRGQAFITGVIERAGDAGLERLWADELDLPTAAEVDAPGLWLARIGLNGGDGGGALGDFEIPDDLSGM